MDSDRKYRQPGYMDSEREARGPREDRPKPQGPRPPIDVTGPRLPRLVQHVASPHRSQWRPAPGANVIEDRPRRHRSPSQRRASARQAPEGAFPMSARSTERSTGRSARAAV